MSKDDKSGRGTITELPSSLTVGELGEKLGVSPINVIKALMRNGIMATINQELEFDVAAIVATDLGVDVVEEGAVVEPEPEAPLVEYPSEFEDRVELEEELEI